MRTRLYGGGIGAFVGLAARTTLGPAGWLIGGVMGAAVGALVDPEEDDGDVL